MRTLGKVSYRGVSAIEPGCISCEFLCIVNNCLNLAVEAIGQSLLQKIQSQRPCHLHVVPNHCACGTHQLLCELGDNDQDPVYLYIQKGS